tara:strand:+ start:1284 stop:2402 length:1119 start_codon:yes stop_codon:yes gene_type:complete
MSYKIDLTNNYPPIKNTDTHCLILTPDYTIGASLYDTELIWKPIANRWNKSSFHNNTNIVNEYQYYIVIKVEDVLFLRFSRDITNMLITFIKVDPGKKANIEFYDYLDDPPIGNFNHFSDCSYNNIIGVEDITQNYYYSGNEWGKSSPDLSTNRVELKLSKHLNGNIDISSSAFIQLNHSPITIIKVAQLSSVISNIISAGGTHRISLRAKKWIDVSSGNGEFINNFYESYPGYFDISKSSIVDTSSTPVPAWKNHPYLDLNNWVDPLTDTSFNLLNFSLKNYRQDLQISSNAGFSTATILNLNKSMRELRYIGNLNSSSPNNTSLASNDFQSYYDEGFRNFQISLLIVDKNYSSGKSKVNPLEIVLTFILP